MIALTANFRRYLPETVEQLMRIDRARGAIEVAQILPAQEDELRRAARVGTIHYSTLIEGNELPLIEAERALRGELEPTTRAKIELVNYVKALEEVDRLYEAGEIVYTPDLVLRLHGLVTRSLGVADSGFEPRHEGCWRDGVAVVADQLGNVFHQAPPADEVPARVEGLCAYLEERRQSLFGPVLAGIAHYAITDIHPFADGNGRVARVLALAALYREGYLSRRLFSPERFYAEDRAAYYDALRSVRRNTLNMDAWLLYYLRGLAEEFERVAERVERLNRLAGGLPRRVQLRPAQERLVAALTTGDRHEVTRADYESLSGLSRPAAAMHLTELVEAGILRRIGRGRATRYRLARRFE